MILFSWAVAVAGSALVTESVMGWRRKIHDL